MVTYVRHKRQPSPRRKAPDPSHQPFIAPTSGWVSATNLAAAPPGSAAVLENWYPTTTGIKMRSGSAKHATAEEDEPLESAFPYVGSVLEMFGACNGSIYNLTTVADPDVPPAADVTGQTSDYYSALNFTTVGGYFLLVANGTDEIQKYDGSSWSAVTTGGGAGQISGVDTDAISHLNAYRNRVWMVEGGTQNAWYLPTDAIAGTAGQVSLQGVFRKGGSLLFTATWSLDAGDGLDDKIVFVSTEGEVAIYQGDPSDAAAWGLVGLFDAAPPLGKNAFLKVGGDLLILTDIGLIPLTAIISKDPAALALAAISRNIQPDWQAEVATRGSLPWEIVKWTSRNICYVSCPVTGDGVAAICFAVNLETGSWSKVTGWETRCFVIHDDQVYFGTNDGTLVTADVGGTDQGENIYYQYVGHMDHLGLIGRYKTVMQARAIFRTKNSFNPRVDVATDYATYSPMYPDAVVIDASDVGEWDVGLWDVAQWDTGGSYYTAQTMWVSIGLSGFAHAPVVLVTSGSTAAPSAELVTIEVTYNPGGIVV